MRDQLYISIQRGLLLLLVISFLFPLSLKSGHFRIYPFDFVLLPMTGFWLARVYGKGTLSLEIVDIILVILVVIILTSSLSALRPSLAIDGGFLWFRAIVVFWFLRDHYVSVYDYDDLVTIAGVLILFQGSVAIVQGVFQVDIGALNQYFGTKSPLKSYRVIDGRRILRAQGTLGNPNTLASWIAVLIPIVVASIPRSERVRFRIAKVITVIVALMGLLFTLSRGIIVITFASLLILGLLVSDRPVLNPYFGTVGLIGLTSISFFFRYIDFIHIIKNSKRIALAQLGLDLFTTSPVIGIGYNNYVLFVHRFFDPSIYLHGMRTTVHNIPLLFLVETGVMGATVFLLLVILIFRSIVVGNNITGWTDYERISYLTLFLVSFGIMQIYITPVSFQFLPLLFALYGVAVGANRRQTVTRASPG